MTPENPARFPWCCPCCRWSNQRPHRDWCACTTVQACPRSFARCCHWAVWHWLAWRSRRRCESPARGRSSAPSIASRVWSGCSGCWTHHRKTIRGAGRNWPPRHADIRSRCGDTETWLSPPLKSAKGRPLLQRHWSSRWRNALWTTRRSMTSYRRRAGSGPRPHWRSDRSTWGGIRRSPGRSGCWRGLS